MNTELDRWSDRVHQFFPRNNCYFKCLLVLLHVSMEKACFPIFWHQLTGPLITRPVLNLQLRQTEHLILSVSTIVIDAKACTHTLPFINPTSSGTLLTSLFMGNLPWWKFTVAGTTLHCGDSGQ